MSIEISKHSPPDEKQVHFAVDENSPQKEDNASQSDEVLRTDEPAIAETQPPKVAVEVENKESSPSSSKVVDAVAVNGESDAISEAIEKRKQPLMELAYSEESYVKRLRVAFELYMPAPYRTSQNIDPNSTASVSPTSPGTAVGFEELASKLPPGGPSVPEDLVARWRILWGNWMQLFEWHTGFYEKLKTLLEEDPDRIPKLFIDSRARLRSIYSKYCENQIKAAHIAEQHKDFFDEWRVHVGDKEDVLSLLMQPVQRIMRYQLPISEIVKWTERAKLPSLPQWQKALDIMKEIPKDTQLILEAARIDGFPGVITALGTLRIRGDLLVASLSCCELADALRSYAKALNIIPSNPANRNSSAISLLTKLHLQSSSTPDDEETIVEGGSVGISTNEPALPSPSVPRPHLNRNPTNTSVTAVEGCEAPTDLPPPLPGGQKFVVSRLFLFDRMLLVTEEVKAKRKGTSADAFAQSTYQFRAAVNVNKMKFEPHWFMCNVMSESDAGEKGDLYTNDWIAVRSALELAAADDLRFALWDQTPGRDVVYIIDPQTVATRSAWVVHLRDIQRMQQQLLMALEEPTRFAGGDKDWGEPRLCSLVLTFVFGVLSKHFGVF
ncbi:unnamed protein product [Mesocestoides corti]|uniref:DH domain-containing protein n=1 Tax=Mesocestoides corti TaxID=53468 RepID=A0A158QVV6_MESCO|nr:unnamed protein product [Mesocestoides corti]